MATAAAWVAVLVAAPFLPAPIAAAVYLAGSFICHQRPERSFHLVGVQLPVCARCLGLYAGAAIGALVALRTGRVRRPRPLVLLAVAPLVGSLVIEWSGLSPLSN